MEAKAAGTAAGEVVGYVDAFDDGVLSGWAARRGDPAALRVEVSCRGAVLGTASAALYREDLVKAGIGSGHHGFAFRVPDAIRRQRTYALEVREVESGEPLGHTPFHVADEPDRPFGGAMALRRFLANQYFKGEGLEIGALHRRMPLPADVRVVYCDSAPVEELARLWSPEVDGHDLAPVDIVSDATTLPGIESGRFDFVIASHVIEHLEDPIRCLDNLLRVTRPGGCVFIAVPDRRYTFDSRRPPTTMSHLFRDYCGGTAASRREHYAEWVRLAENLSGAEGEARRAKLESEGYPIHFHVWQPSEFSELLHAVREVSAVPFDVDLFKMGPAEGVWILRRSVASTPS